jgi:cytochrome o ubiquinol oxidase subunit 2
MGTPALLNPKGLIALSERNLMITAVLLMLVVVIPALFFTYYFAWKYGDKNKRTVRPKEIGGKRSIVFLYWLFPSLIILALALVTWQKTHALDPYKSIASQKTPITIQVVAMQWKWLFIYPEQGIATVNFLEIPKDTPVNLQLTSDGPMNSFWIPQLAGQMYAMAGMSTTHHIIASAEGEFAGSAAEINGAGFSGMRFVAKSVSDQDFDDWVTSVQSSSRFLDQYEYMSLSQPSEYVTPTDYSGVDENLYNTVIAKYMAPGEQMDMSEKDHQTY